MSMIDRETANQEFDRFVEAYRIDMDLDDLDENERRDLNQDRARIVRAIERGYLAIEEDGTPVQTLGDGTELRWGRPRGSSWLAMDKKKKSADIAKAFASMAELTRQSVAVFSNMEAADLKIAMAIWSLFLA